MCQFIRAAIAKHQRPSAEQQYFLTIVEAKNPRSRCADLVSSEAFIRHAVDHLLIDILHSRVFLLRGHRILLD